MNFDETQTEVEQLRKENQNLRINGNRLAALAVDQLFEIENSRETIREAIKTWSETNGS